MDRLLRSPSFIFVAALVYLRAQEEEEEDDDEPKVLDWMKAAGLP